MNCDNYRKVFLLKCNQSQWGMTLPTKPKPDSLLTDYEYWLSNAYRSMYVWRCEWAETGCSSWSWNYENVEAFVSIFGFAKHLFFLLVTICFTKSQDNSIVSAMHGWESRPPNDISNCISLLIHHGKAITDGVGTCLFGDLIPYYKQRFLVEGVKKGWWCSKESLYEAEERIYNMQKTWINWQGSYVTLVPQ